MKKTAVTLAVLAGLLSPAVSEGSLIELENKKYVPHDMRGGGVFYGSGVDHLLYSIKVEKPDVKATNYETLLSIATELERAVYNLDRCHPTAKDIASDILDQNIGLYAAHATEHIMKTMFGLEKEKTGELWGALSLLKERDVLHYKAARAVGRGLLSIF